MPALGDAKGRFQVDRLLSNLRWVLLLGVALLTFLEAFARGQVVLEPAYLLPRLFLLCVAVLYNVAVVILLSRGSISRLLPAITLFVDTLLIIGLVLTSGGMASLLLVFGLFPVLTAALRFDQPISLLVSLMVTASLGGALYTISPRGPWSGPNPLFALMLALAIAAVVGSVLNMRLRAVFDRNRESEIETERRKLHAAREHSRLTFELASTLSASLKYNKVLDAVLEVADKGLKELGRDDAGQVGMPYEEQARRQVEDLVNLLDVAVDDVGLEDVLVPVVARRAVDVEEFRLALAGGELLEELPPGALAPAPRQREAPRLQARPGEVDGLHREGIEVLGAGEGGPVMVA